MKRCVMCGEPMHRFGFPQDADGHEPSATACINGLRGRLEKLEGAEARLRETGLHLLAYIDQGDLSGLQFDAIYKDFRDAITQEERK